MINKLQFVLVNWGEAGRASAQRAAPSGREPLPPRPPLPAALCAGPPSATRLLTQLPTSVGSCSDRRQSTSSQATHHHPSSTARSNRIRLLRVPLAPRGSRERGNSELPPRTLRSLRREPQSLTALRILFSPSLRVRVTG